MAPRQRLPSYRIPLTVTSQHELSILLGTQKHRQTLSAGNQILALDAFGCDRHLFSVVDTSLYPNRGQLSRCRLQKRCPVPNRERHACAF